jgi:hypothetical protein
MKIILNEAQSKILLEIALKDLLPKELEKRRKMQLEKREATRQNDDNLE